MYMAGRPRLYNSPEEMQVLITKYFNDCKNRDVPYTLAGLAVALGMDRISLYNYSKRDEYFNTIKKAKDIVAQAWEEHAFIKGNAGSIFVMKNYGYTDRQEVSVEHSNFGEVLDKFVGKL